MRYNFKEISNNFKKEGTFESCIPYGSGHINETFLLKTKEKTSPDYILQRINHKIFQDIPGLMNNIQKVTLHLHKKLEQIPNSNPDKEILTLIPTLENKPFLHWNNNFWRLYLYIWPNKSYDIVPNAETAYEGGKTFGKFQYLLSDLPGSSLVETIPDFHNIEKRLKSFYSILEKDPKRRASSLKKEIDFVEKYGKSMSHIMDLGKSNQIPKRVTHNDTKFNNVLLDENNKGLCVIDLDTVMPGYIHYDFGDTIRTATNTAAEDEKNLSKVSMDINIFEGFAKGFLRETSKILNKTEIENLVFSGRLITFTIGLRFITDYIDGDNYFKTHYPDHNLDRCRAQFKLFNSQLAQEEQMEELIKKIITNLP